MDVLGVTESTRYTGGPTDTRSLGGPWVPGSGRTKCTEGTGK